MGEKEAAGKKKAAETEEQKEAIKPEADSPNQPGTPGSNPPPPPKDPIYKP